MISSILRFCTLKEHSQDLETGISYMRCYGEGLNCCLPWTRGGCILFLVNIRLHGGEGHVHLQLARVHLVDGSGTRFASYSFISPLRSALATYKNVFSLSSVLLCVLKREGCRLVRFSNWAVCSASCVQQGIYCNCCFAKLCFRNEYCEMNLPKEPLLSMPKSGSW